MDIVWSLRPSTERDAAWMTELRAVVMRPDLERLGRFDEGQVRERFLAAFDPAVTRVVLTSDRHVGLVALRSAPEATWLEDFHLAPGAQGAGLGTAVLSRVLTEARVGLPIRLNVLACSRAVHLYERHGFHTYASDPVDVWMQRPRA